MGTPRAWKYTVQQARQQAQRSGRPQRIINTVSSMAEAVKQIVKEEIGGEEGENNHIVIYVIRDVSSVAFSTHRSLVGTAAKSNVYKNNENDQRECRNWVRRKTTEVLAKTAAHIQASVAEFAGQSGYTAKLVFCDIYHGEERPVKKEESERARREAQVRTERRKNGRMRCGLWRDEVVIEPPKEEDKSTRDIKDLGVQIIRLTSREEADREIRRLVTIAEELRRRGREGLDGDQDLYTPGDKTEPIKPLPFDDVEETKNENFLSIARSVASVPSGRRITFSNDWDVGGLESCFRRWHIRPRVGGTPLFDPRPLPPELIKDKGKGKAKDQDDSVSEPVVSLHEHLPPPLSLNKSKHRTAPAYFGHLLDVAELERELPHVRSASSTFNARRDAVIGTDYLVGGIPGLGMAKGTNPFLDEFYNDDAAWSTAPDLLKRLEGFLPELSGRTAAKTAARKEHDLKAIKKVEPSAFLAGGLVAAVACRLGEKVALTTKKTIVSPASDTSSSPLLIFRNNALTESCKTSKRRSSPRQPVPYSPPPAAISAAILKNPFAPLTALPAAQTRSSRLLERQEHPLTTALNNARRTTLAPRSQVEKGETAGEGAKEGALLDEKEDDPMEQDEEGEPPQPYRGPRPRPQRGRPPMGSARTFERKDKGPLLDGLLRAKQEARKSDGSPVKPGAEEEDSEEEEEEEEGGAGGSVKMGKKRKAGERDEGEKADEAEEFADDDDDDDDGGGGGGGGSRKGPKTHKMAEYAYITSPSHPVKTMIRNVVPAFIRTKEVQRDASARPANRSGAKIRLERLAKVTNGIALLQCRPPDRASTSPPPFTPPSSSPKPASANSLTPPVASPSQPPHLQVKIDRPLLDFLAFTYIAILQIAKFALSAADVVYRLAAERLEEGHVAVGGTMFGRKEGLRHALAELVSEAGRRSTRKEARGDDEDEQMAQEKEEDKERQEGEKTRKGTGALGADLRDDVLKDLDGNDIPLPHELATSINQAFVTPLATTLNSAATVHGMKDVDLFGKYLAVNLLDHLPHAIASTFARPAWAWSSEAQTALASMNLNAKDQKALSKLLARLVQDDPISMERSRRGASNGGSNGPGDKKKDKGKGKATPEAKVKSARMAAKRQAGAAKREEEGEEEKKEPPQKKRKTSATSSVPTAGGDDLVTIAKLKDNTAFKRMVPPEAQQEVLDGLTVLLAYRDRATVIQVDPDEVKYGTSTPSATPPSKGALKVDNKSWASVLKGNKNLHRQLGVFFSTIRLMSCRHRLPSYNPTTVGLNALALSMLLEGKNRQAVLAIAEQEVNDKLNGIGPILQGVNPEENAVAVQDLFLDATSSGFDLLAEEEGVWTSQTKAEFRRAICAGRRVKVRRREGLEKQLDGMVNAVRDRFGLEPGAPLSRVCRRGSKGEKQKHDLGAASDFLNTLFRLKRLRTDMMVTGQINLSRTSISFGGRNLRRWSGKCSLPSAFNKRKHSAGQLFRLRCTSSSSWGNMHLSRYFKLLEPACNYKPKRIDDKVVFDSNKQAVVNAIPIRPLAEPRSGTHEQILAEKQHPSTDSHASLLTSLMDDTTSRPSRRVKNGLPSSWKSVRFNSAELEQVTDENQHEFIVAGVDVGIVAPIALFTSVPTVKDDKKGRLEGSWIVKRKRLLTESQYNSKVRSAVNNARAAFFAPSADEAVFPLPQAEDDQPATDVPSVHSPRSSSSTGRSSTPRRPSSSKALDPSVPAFIPASTSQPSPLQAHNPAAASSSALATRSSPPRSTSAPLLTPTKRAAAEAAVQDLVRWSPLNEQLVRTGQARYKSLVQRGANEAAHTLVGGEAARLRHARTPALDKVTEAARKELPTLLRPDEVKIKIFVGDGFAANEGGAGRHGAESGNPIWREIEMSLRRMGYSDVSFIKTPEYLTSKRCSEPTCIDGNGHRNSVSYPRLENGGTDFRLVECSTTGPRPHVFHRDGNAAVNMVVNGLVWEKDGGGVWGGGEGPVVKL